MHDAVYVCAMIYVVLYNIVLPTTLFVTTTSEDELRK
jgi:hypothetical protein